MKKLLRPMKEFNDFTPMDAIKEIKDFIIYINENDKEIEADERISDSIKRLEALIEELTLSPKMTLQEFWESKKKLVIHCETEEQAKKFCEESNKLGKAWCNHYNFLTSDNMWNDYKESTCYTNKGEYCYKGWFEKHKYRILEFEEIKWDC